MTLRAGSAMSTLGAELMRIASLFAGLLGTGCAPLLVFPGGELRGALDSSVIDDWGFTPATRRRRLRSARRGFPLSPP